MSDPRPDAPDPTRALADGCAAAALDKKATDVVLLDVRGLTSIVDWFVIASGRSDTQVRAIAESVEEACRGLGRRPLWVEGLRHGQWVLLDYGDVVVHVFYGPVREFYDLERLWAKAPRVDVEPTTPAPDAGGSAGRKAAR
ncbi:MAG: ribosome silencing factor [Alphaproteobacteria bacterium]